MLKKGGEWKVGTWSNVKYSRGGPLSVSSDQNPC